MRAVELFNEAVDMHNKANDLKDLQDAADHFLKNSYKCGVTYDNRQKGVINDRACNIE